MYFNVFVVCVVVIKFILYFFFMILVKCLLDVKAIFIEKRFVRFDIERCVFEESFFWKILRVE